MSCIRGRGKFEPVAMRQRRALEVVVAVVAVVVVVAAVAAVPVIRVRASDRVEVKEVEREVEWRQVSKGNPRQEVETI